MEVSHWQLQTARRDEKWVSSDPNRLPYAILNTILKMTTTSVYSEAELSQSHSCIRLLQILDGAPGDPICCRIKSYSLQSCPSYTALSYTWGPAEDSYEIFLNRHAFRVRSNLYHFIYQTRSQKKWRYFWIDAICIDQGSVLERNHQVRLMKDIYSKVRGTSVQSPVANTRRPRLL